MVAPVRELEQIITVRVKDRVKLSMVMLTIRTLRASKATERMGSQDSRAKRAREGSVHRSSEAREVPF